MNNFGFFINNFINFIKTITNENCQFIENNLKHIITKIFFTYSSENIKYKVMSVRRGESDSKLSRLLKSKIDDDSSLGNFLPNFLLKDINAKEEAKMKNDLDLKEEEKSNIFESREEDDVNNYFHFLNVKDVSINS
jgi:hypothetical protein